MPTFAEILGLAAQKAQQSVGAGYLAQPNVRRVDIQATPPPVGRVYRLQAQMPIPPEHQMTPAEQALVPRETIIQLPQLQMTPAEQALVPRQVIIERPKKKRK